MPLELMSEAREEDLFWEFAVAEFDSDRYGSFLLRRLSPKLTKLVQSGDKSVLTEGQWAELRTAVLGYRGGYIQSLIDLGVTWQCGRIPIGDCANVRLVRDDELLGLAPSRTLAELVDALDKVGSRSGGGFATNYRLLRPIFDLTKAKGLPVLVCEERVGPFTEVEGLTRLAVRYSFSIHGTQQAIPVYVLVGFCPRLREWYFNQ